MRCSFNKSPIGLLRQEATNKQQRYHISMPSPSHAHGLPRLHHQAPITPPSPRKARASTDPGSAPPECVGDRAGAGAPGGRAASDVDGDADGDASAAAPGVVAAAGMAVAAAVMGDGVSASAPVAAWSWRQRPATNTRRACAHETRGGTHPRKSKMSAATRSHACMNKHDNAGALQPRKGVKRAASMFSAPSPFPWQPTTSEPTRPTVPVRQARLSAIFTHGRSRVRT